MLAVLIGSHYLNAECLVGAGAEEHKPVTLSVLLEPPLSLLLEECVLANGLRKAVGVNDSVRFKCRADSLPIEKVLPSGL